MADRNDRKSRRQEDSDSTALAIPGFGGFGLPSLFEDFMRPFNEFMAPIFPRPLGSLWTEFGGKEPVIDMQDRGDHYVMTAELPGFEKDDVEVRVSGKALELKAEKRADKESRDDRGMRRQSSYSFVQKVVPLPEAVLSEKVVGTVRNGVLELKLPKAEPKRLDRSKRVTLK
jgi:HSP20 family protein